MSKDLPQGELIVTNLDSWAAWYHDLTTMWFPLSPEMLTNNPPKYIVLTNYLEDDADFALNAWKEVVYTPYKIENEFLSKNYILLNTFEVGSYRGTILARKL
jgi:hypothetical protein